MFISRNFNLKRSKLEQAVPVWSAGLTKAQDKSIERVQKTALSIIFGIYINRDNYARACSIAGIEPLAERRKALSLNYGLKNFKSKHSFFTKEETRMDTRSEKKLVKEFNCRTSRFERSSLPYIASLINEHHRQKRRTNV